MSDQHAPFAPYKGLIPYGEEDANFFFGRQRERDMIEANLIASRLTLLYGASGVGKSSVLRAGVVHHLRHLAIQNQVDGGNPEFVVVIVNAWRDDPLGGLLNSIYTTLQADLGPLHPAVASLPPPSAAAFVPTLQAWTTALDCDLLLILDQFEEYLFYHATEDGLGTLAMEFPRAVNTANLRVNFLIAIREDALARLDRFKGRIPRLFENYLRIQHLDVEAAREAIEQPLAAYNREAKPAQPISIEPELVAEVLAQVQTNQVFVGESGRGTVAGGGPARVETPYLQLVMSRLWAEELHAGASVLRLETLQRLGGAERIVRTHLDTVIATLAPEEQEMASRIFHHLVTPSGTKIAHTVPDLAEYSGLAASQLEPVLEKLSGADMRILRPVAPPPDQPTRLRYEIFHDVLAAPILDWRVRFVYAQEQIATEARLASERAAAEARLQQQQAEAAARLAQERRRVQSLRQTALGLAALLILMVGLALYARQQYVKANEATNAAYNAAARSMAVNANLQLQSDPELSVLLARNAAWTDNHSVQVEDALRQALIASSIRAVLTGHAEGLSDAVFSPDGQWLATADTGGLIGIWDAATYRNMAWLRDHPQHVFELAFSPDSRLLASGGTGAVVRIWDVPSGALRVEIPNLGGEIYDVSFSPDGKLLAIAGGGHTGYVWDVQAGVMTLFLEGHRNGLTRVAFSPDGALIATASADSTARLWETATGRTLAVLAGHTAEVLTISFDASGQWLATGSADNTARVWRAPSGESYQVFRGHTDRVNGVQLSADGRRLYTGSADGRAIVWDVASGQAQAELRHTDRVTDLRLSPDERLLLTTSADHTAALWNTATWQRLSALRGHGDAINRGAFDPSGARVVTAGQDQTARVWTANTGQSLQELHEMTGTQSVWSVAFSPDGTRLITANDNGTVGLWDPLGGRRLATLRGHEGAVYQARFGPAGKSFFSVGLDGTVRVWAADGGGASVVWRGHSDAINSIAFGKEGQLALTASNDQTAVVWDVASGQAITTLRGHRGVVLNGHFNHDSSRAVTASADHTAIVWDVSDWTPVTTLTGHEGLIYDAIFSPVNDRIATASADGSARLWDGNTGEPVTNPLVHGEAVTHVIFTADGRYLLTASQDHTAALWETASGRRVFSLIGQQAPVTAVALSPDGRFAITGGDTGDPTVRLWDLRTGQMLLTFWGHNAGVRGLDFSADGRHFASAGADGTVQVYDCDVCGSVEALLALVPSRVTRELTDEEQHKFLYSLPDR